MLAWQPNGASSSCTFVVLGSAHVGRGQVAPFGSINRAPEANC